MTDEEKMNDFYKQNICHYCSSAYRCSKPFSECIEYPFAKILYFAGLAEGRKKVTYMTAKEYDKTLDKCKECYLDMVDKFSKRNEDLEKENEQLKNELQDYQFNYDNIKELSKENAELKKQIEKMKDCKNNYVVSDKNSNAVPCYTIYNCRNCPRKERAE